jgi:hypothetical protein
MTHYHESSTVCWCGLMQYCAMKVPEQGSEPCQRGGRQRALKLGQAGQDVKQPGAFALHACRPKGAYPCHKLKQL